MTGSATIDGDVNGDLVIDGAADVGSIAVAGEVRIAGASRVGDVTIDGSVESLAFPRNATVESDLAVAGAWPTAPT